MAFRRYGRDSIINQGIQFGTSESSFIIRRAVQLNLIPFTTTTILGQTRLDTLSGKIYGHSNLWWILASASGIGWGLQVPPGTRVVIPDLERVIDLIA